MARKMVTMLSVKVWYGSRLEPNIRYPNIANAKEMMLNRPYGEQSAAVRTIGLRPCTMLRLEPRDE